MKNFCILFFLLIVQQLHAQIAQIGVKLKPQNTISTTGTSIPDAGVAIANPVPASPDAAALGKYGNIPVSPYTGTPNISIPLYTIKSGDLTLPISLSYHSSGNKVEEMASSVGLGWSLNAGGVITRTIRGKPDEELNGFLTQNSAAQINSMIANTSNLTSAQQGQLDYYLNATADGTLDSEPDIYNFNFAGYSGQFLMDGLGHITVMPLQNIVFTFNVWSGQTTYINSFTAKTPDGVTYYFGSTGATGAIEFTSPAGSNNQHAISWYLYKITSPSFHEIDFTYTPESYSFSTCGQQTFYLWLGATGCWGSPCSGGGNIPPVQTQAVTYHFNNVKLSSITFENGTLQIYTGNGRNDINPAGSAAGAKCVDTIAITSGSFAKLYKFYYLNTTNNRLRLDSLTGQLEPIAGTNNYKKEKYSFTYNKDAWTNNYMFMYSQDYWGYYNAQGNIYGNGGILVPQLPAPNDGAPGANRAPDESSMQTGLLTQITYPTGGYTQFTYEANTERNANLNGTSSKYPKNYYSATIATDPLYYNCKSDSNDICYYNRPSSYNTDVILPLNITGVNGTPVNLSVSANGLAAANPPPSPPAPMGNVIQASIFQYDSNHNKVGVYNFTATSGTASVMPGQYYLELRDPKSQGDSLQFTNPVAYYARVDWAAYTPAEVQAMKGNNIAGGVRIQQIADYDGVSSKPINLRRYKYTLPDSTASSGWMGPMPVYTYQLDVESTVMSANVAVASWVDEYLTRCSVSNYPLATTQGEVVGYSHVEEFFGKNGEDGENEYFYTNLQSDPDLPPIGGDNFPFAPPQNYDWHRGLLLKQTTWKNNGAGSFTKVNEKASSYNTIKSNLHNYGIKAGFNPKPAHYNQYTSYYTNPMVSELGRIQETTYSINTDHTYLTADTTRTYDPADQTKFIQTISSYQIDTTTYLTRQVQTTNSKNELITQTVTYPYDYLTFANPSNGSLVGIQNLYNMGISSYPIEEVTQKSNPNGTNLRTIKAVLSTYKPNRAYRDSVYEMRSVAGVTNFVNSSPGTNTVLKDSHYQPIISFDKYDLYGNILQERKVGDASHTYLWGYSNPNPPYDNTYPIAEAINADSASIAYTNFENYNANSMGNWAFNSAGLAADTTAPMGSRCYNIGASNILTKNGLNAASSYVVSFWAKSGAAITVTGGTATNIATGNAKSGWIYHEYQVTGTTTVTVGGTGLIDEVRLYPSTAQMSTYTYVPLVGMASKCDTKNDITYYIYDNVGRLTQVLDQNRNIIKQYQYNYANSAR